MNNLPPLPDDMRPVLREFLATHSTLALATAGEQDGRPQVTPLFFASDNDLNIYWISSPDSRHSVNIADWDDVAATVYEPTWEWTGIRGVQIEGTARAVIGDEERNRALTVYSGKFPFVNEKFSGLIEESTFYVLRPRWIRWLDNARRFGYKQEFTLQPTDDDASDN